MRYKIIIINDCRDCTSREADYNFNTHGFCHHPEILHEYGKYKEVPFEGILNCCPLTDYKE